MTTAHAWIDYCRATLRGEHPPEPAPVYEVDDIGYQRPAREKGPAEAGPSPKMAQRDPVASP